MALACSTAVRDLTSKVQLLSYQNTSTDVLVCQIVVLLGDGANNLDGTGGEFELSLNFGSNTVQPEPQIITFSTDVQSSVFTCQFPLPRSQTVTCAIKSPNAADTAVWVRACIYEVGVQSLRDEIDSLIAALNTRTWVFNETRTGTYRGSTSSGIYPSLAPQNSGVYPSAGPGTGVYPGGVSR